MDGDHLEIDLRGRGPARAEAVVVALTMSFAWVGSVLLDATYASRYASVLLPIVLVLVTRGLLELRNTRALLPVVILLAVLALVGGVANVITDRTQAGDIAAEVRSGAAPGDLVVICPDQLGPSVSRGLPESLGLVTLRYPDLGDPTRVEWRDYIERSRAADPAAVAAEVVQRAADAESVWVVASGAYRGTEGQCDVLRGHLAERSARSASWSPPTTTPSASRPASWCSARGAAPDPAIGDGTKDIEAIRSGAVAASAFPLDVAGLPSHMRGEVVILLGHGRTGSAP